MKLIDKLLNPVVHNNSLLSLSPLLMKQSLFALSILSLLILWGCFKKTETPDTNGNTAPEEVRISAEAQAEADKRVTGNDTCDAYLATIKCIAEKGGANNEFTKNYDSIVTSFTNIPVEQLQETCTELSTALQQHPTLLLYNAECNMINPDQNLIDAINSSSTGATGTDSIAQPQAIQ